MLIKILGGDPRSQNVSAMVYKDGISNVMDKGLCHYLQSKDPINTSMPFLMASFINHKLIKKMLIKIVKIVLIHFL